jgi:chromosome partitioning protein
MVASDYILIPVECEYPAIQGLRVLFRAYEWAKQYNRNLGVLGILPCFYDRQSHHTHEVLEKMQKFYPDWMLEPIRRSPRFVEAPFEWRRMLDYAGKMPEVEAYRRLAEVIDHARGRGR